MADKADSRTGTQVFGNPDEEPEPDEWFPLEVDGAGEVDVSNVRVRSDDSVQVKMVKRVPEKRIEYRERFWCHVVSVTSAGVITAVPKSKLKWANISPDTPVSFSVNRVIRVIHGSNWA